MRPNRAAGAAPNHGRSPDRDSDLLRSPETPTSNPRNLRTNARFSARGYSPLLRRDRRCPQKRSPRTRHDPRSVCAAIDRERTTVEYNLATKRAARTIKRRFETGAGYTESNSKYVLQNSLLAALISMEAEVIVKWTQSACAPHLSLSEDVPLAHGRSRPRVTRQAEGEVRRRLRQQRHLLQALHLSLTRVFVTPPWTRGDSEEASAKKQCPLPNPRPEPPRG
jgi:hypothetical protein